MKNKLEKIIGLKQKLNIVDDALKKEYKRVESLYQDFDASQIDSKKAWRKYNLIVNTRIYLVSRINEYKHRR